MNEFLKLSDKDRTNILTQASIKKNLSLRAIEKDWWVTMTLRALFECQCFNHIVFKGGTSLSKAWNLIERLSEDIDIAIDRKFFGFEGELKNRQINNLRRASCSYIKDTLQHELNQKLRENGIVGYYSLVPETEATTKDPQIIEIHFNSLFTPDYVQNKVVIEMGARSLIEPSKNVLLRSIVADLYPNTGYADGYFIVPTVIPQRTFLEKAFLLHEEFQKPPEKIRVERMSRHIYDLEKMMDTDYATDALSNTDLYNTIVQHRRTLTALKEVDYNTHVPEKISFVPPTFVLASWRKDYEDMQSGMIYGKSLPFDSLVKRIEELNNRFRKIKICRI